MQDVLSIPDEQRRRLLVFNLRTDIDDHILGFTTSWINALAPFYETIDVLTTHRGRVAVAENVRVYSTGREEGLGRLAQLSRFYTTLIELVMNNHYDACFAHMQPLFATLAAPVLRLRGIRITTWYTHRQMNWMVRMAEKWSFRVVTAVPSSFPLPTSKLRPLGHGIDPTRFNISNIPQDQPPLIVHVARLTAIKHQHILLEAVQGIDCRVVLVGDVPDGYADDYKQLLMARVKQLQLQDRVVFAGAQTPVEVVNWYNRATIAVNLSPAGLFDKAALEAMACALPTIVSNPAFNPLLDDYSPLLSVSAPDDVDAVRRRILSILNLDDAQYREMGLKLRARVIEQHSLDSLVHRLIYVMHTGELPG